MSTSKTALHPRTGGPHTQTARVRVATDPGAGRSEYPRNAPVGTTIVLADGGSARLGSSSALVQTESEKARVTQMSALEHFRRAIMARLGRSTPATPVGQTTDTPFTSMATIASPRQVIPELSSDLTVAEQDCADLDGLIRAVEMALSVIRLDRETAHRRAESLRQNLLGGETQRPPLLEPRSRLARDSGTVDLRDEVRAVPVAA